MEETDIQHQKLRSESQEEMEVESAASGGLEGQLKQPIENNKKGSEHDRVDETMMD